MRALLVLLIALPAFAGDLTVGWISRQPEIAYVWNSSNPAVEGWPSPGEAVTWRAHVRSWMDSAVTVEYRWLLDDVEIARGTKEIAANATTLIDLERPWSFRRERLRIELSHVPAEESHANNALEVFTDAISVGMWVEQSLYDWFRAHQGKLGIGSTSFENWAQRHITHYNDLAAMAVYPETPHGVIDRWRLQKIVLVPDEALPLVKPPDYLARGGEPNGMTHPDMSDRTVDLQIGLRTSTLRSYQQTGGATFGNPFYLNAVMLHELGHARYLTDVYGFDIVPKPWQNVEVAAELPFYTPERGLMHSDYTWIDRYSAIALNRIAGRRATVGNYNDPENVGIFLDDLPASNRLVIRDPNGAPIPDATVEIFQSEPFRRGDHWYAMHFDTKADLTLQTDEEGRVDVGRNPFGGDRIVHYWRGSNTVAIVKVTKGASVAWGFLEVRVFNLAYWRGQVDFAEHDLVVGRRGCARDVVLSSPGWGARVENAMTVRWLAVEGATAYRVYVAPAGGAPRLVATTTAIEATVPVSGSAYWWVEADLANCPSVRSPSSKVEAQFVAPAKKRRAA